MAQEPAAPSLFGPRQNPVKSIVPLGVLYALRKVDFANDPEALHLLRLGFAATQVVAFLLAALLYVRIEARKGDGKTFTHQGKSVSVYEHDRAQMTQAGTGLLATMAIVAFLHFQFKFWQPLILVGGQALLNYIDGAQLKLLQAYLLGMEVERPFPGGPAAPAPAAEGKGAKSGEEKKPGGNPKKAGKSKKAD
mmetsp:Transcript_22167/g.74576  ORF Transcript_22167/g.74576 Transcript_22167/m.74576 type:complete len:193 (-) Transcript_22167:584-1162(-)